MNIKKGDIVMILAGKDKGKKGKVINVYPDEAKLLVEGANIAKRHQKPTRNFPGGIIEKPMAMPISKVMLVCPRCSEPHRLGAKTVGEKKVRVCRGCSEIVDKV